MKFRTLLRLKRARWLPGLSFAFALGCLPACLQNEDEPSSVPEGSGGEGGTGEGGEAGGTSASAGQGGQAASQMAGGSAGMMGGQGGTAGGGTGGAVVSAGGAGGSAGMGGAGSVVPSEEDHPAGYVKAIMAVGYGGIRVMSRDNGLTWKRTAQLGTRGGDDENLLVSVAWGKGRWIATFTWHSWFSTDGFTWKEFDPQTGCRALVRVAYGNGIFVGTACSPGNSTSSFVSTDGVKWTKKGTIPSGFHMNLLFAPADGKFVTWGEDDHKIHTSVDGVTWTRVTGMPDVAVCDGKIKTVSACKNSFGHEGMWIRAEGSLSRSTDGVKFTRVYADDSGNSIPSFFSLAWGWAPAP